MNKRGYTILFILSLLALTLVGCKKEHVHEWNEGTIVKEATCTEEGVKEFKCLGCNEVETENLGYGEHKLIDATCTKGQTCSYCESLVSMPLGHDWKVATLSAPKTCNRCHETEGLNLLDQAIEEAVPTSTSSKVNLPSNILGYVTTWESIDQAIMLSDGTIVYNDSTKIAVLKANINIDGTIVEKEVKIKVYTPYVDMLVYNYAQSMYTARFNKELYSDVKLITDEYEGCRPIYESLDETVITSEGVITKQTFSQIAIMNVYVIKDGIAVLYPIEITVADYTSIERIELAKEEVEVLMEQLEKGEIDTLPFYSEKYDVDYAWIADRPDFVVLEDRILLPIEKTNVRLKCTISRETIISAGNTKVESDDVKFALENVGGNTIESFLDAWLQTILPTEIIAHKNILTEPDANGEMYLDRQYAVNTGAVLNLIDGKNLTINQEYYINTNDNLVKENFYSTYHKAINPMTDDSSGETLRVMNEHFYEGYKIPNKENILWIVVHESGMPREGQNAELLADIQYENAYGLGRTTTASWHYQVDETTIYQSFNDNVAAWHAGGSYGKWLPYGNANSIGIEMCINQDGNYDGSMAHDAKLVAELMHRYNLTMDNVVRHHDTSGKECPSYMLRTNRYGEFLEKVCKEYVAMKYLKDAEVTWTISNPDLFTKGPNGLYYSKRVTAPTDVTITLNVKKGDYTFSGSSTITLKPDGVAA